MQRSRPAWADPRQPTRGSRVEVEAQSCPANGWTLVASRDPDDLGGFVETAAEALA